MKRSQILREQLEDAILKQKDLLDLAETEGQRDFDEAEEKTFNEAEADIVRLEAEIKKAEQRENAEERAANMKRQPKNEEKVAQKRFSFLKAIDSLSRGEQLTGIEKELHDEGTREASDKNLRTGGNLTLPSWMLAERTTLTAATDATAGYLVDDVLAKDLIPALRPKLLVEGLGAKVWGNLTGDLTLPRRTTDMTATWEGETDAAAESNTIYDTISLSPNRLGMYTDLSRQLLIQDSVGVEKDVRDSIAFAIAKAVDSAAINGSGASNQPTGILNTSGIGSVALGTHGAVPTLGDLVELETKIAIDNADVDNMAYLTTPGIRGLLKQTPRVASTNDNMIWDYNGSMLNGYKAVVSTQVPSTLTKGTSTTCHAILLANWADLIIANWGGLDIIVDNLTQATTAKVRLHVFSWWDIAVRHPESFAAIQDALLA